MFRRLSSRFVRSSAFGAAASAAAAAGVLCYKPKSVACGDEPVTANIPKKLGGRNVELADFELYHGYQVHFDENSTKPIAKADLVEILLHCGILDPAMSDFLFNSLVAMDVKANKGKKKGAKAAAKAVGEGGVETVSYDSFVLLCTTIAKGDDKSKWEVMFDFMDPDKSGMADKNEISTAIRHLLWCQTNWYGEEILYDGPFDLDLYFDVSTEHIAQLKANKFAHELVMSCHGGGRQQAVNKQQFLQWMARGGKRVETLKGLFSVFGAYEAPHFLVADVE